MSERGALLSTLDRLFAGPRESVLTLDEFLNGLETRSYAFAIAALDVINVVPTGIPWLSTVTGVPMFPPTRVFLPLLLKISPTSVVVVVFPLEPVMAMTLP